MGTIEEVIEGRFQIPEFNPILYEIWCLHYGSTVFGKECALLSNDDSEKASKRELSLIVLECVFCRDKINVENIGVRYTKALHDELVVSTGKQLSIPRMRPIHYELHCRSCGGHLYGIRDNDIYPTKDGIQSKVVYTFIEFKCIDCGITAHLEELGVKYEEQIRDDVGWPVGEFPQPITFDEEPATPDFFLIYSDSIIDESKDDIIQKSVEMNSRDQVSLGYSSIKVNVGLEQPIQASKTTTSRAQGSVHMQKYTPFWKEVETYIQKRDGRQTDLLSSTRRLSTHILHKWTQSYMALITKIGGKYGLQREWQESVIYAQDFDDDAVVEVGGVTMDGLKRRIYYRVEKELFIPFIQIWKR